MGNNYRRDAGDEKAAEAAASVKSGAVEDGGKPRVLDRSALFQHGASGSPADNADELEDTCELPFVAHSSRGSATAGDNDAQLAQQAQELERLLARCATSEQALRDSEQRTEVFERLLTEAGKEIAELRSTLAARDALVQRLEVDLHAKQQALDAARHSGSDGKATSSPAAQAASAKSTDEWNDIGVRMEAHRPARKMIVVADGGRRTSYVLHKSETTIGRATAADIRLQSPFISRIHARVYLRDAETFIEDLGSKNGILVNAQPVEDGASLHDGDIVTLGGMLEFEYIDFERSAGV